jgi:hypothetical protein
MQFFQLQRSDPEGAPIRSPHSRNVVESRQDFPEIHYEILGSARQARARP